MWVDIPVPWIPWVDIAGRPGDITAAPKNSRF